MKGGFEALILAAGRGRRLGQLGLSTPKCLLNIGGQTLLGRMITGLISNDCNAITIITGYKTDFIEEYVSSNLEKYRDKIRFLKNKDYLMSGSFESLRIGCKGVTQSPLWIFDSDIIFSSKLFSLIAQHTSTIHSMVMTVPYTGNPDAVFVKSDLGILSGIGKTIHEPEVFPYLNEFIGITLLNIEAVARVAVEPENSFVEYEDWINFFLRFMPFYENCQPSLLWREIDTPDDLTKAQLQNWNEPLSGDVIS